MPKKSDVRLTKEFVDSLPTDREAVFWDREVKGFGLRIKQGGKRTYVLQYRNKGGRSRRITLGQHGALTPKEAEKLARAALGRVAAGEDPAEDKAEERKAMTVKELCDLYCDAVRKGLILGKRGLPKKASTFSVDQGRIIRHIIPLLGRRAVRDLTAPDLNRFQRDIVSGKTAADIKTKSRGRAIVEGGRGTATRTMGLLGGILSYAVSEGIIENNPSRGVKRAADGRRKIRLSAEQYKALGDALRKAEAEGDAWQGVQAVWMLALTGCRKGEVEKLKPSEVDVSGSTLRLADSKEGESVRPLGQAALEIVKPRLGKSKFVFHSDRNPDKPYGSLPAAWERISKRIDPKIEMPHLTLHGLRHAYASIAGDLGYSDPTIAALIGHANQGTTTRGYIHHLDEALIAAADKVSGQIYAFMRFSDSMENGRG